jgi:GR25 family glycosyltransferase involved in LPS biosynthesis
MSVSFILFIIVYAVSFFFLFRFILDMYNAKGQRDAFSPNNNNTNAFVINLPRNEDRLTRFRQQIAGSDFGDLEVNKFDAVDGKTTDITKWLNNDTQQELKEVTRNNYRTSHYQLTYGGVGCFLSHYSLAKQLMENTDTNINQYLIFEDDVDIPPVFMETLARVMEDLPDDWDIVLLGTHRINEGPIVKSKHDTGVIQFVKANAFWGMFAYVINKRGASTFVNEVATQPIDGQVDAYLSRMNQQNKLNIYAVKPTQQIAESKGKFTTIQIPLKEVAGRDPYMYGGYHV